MKILVTGSTGQLGYDVVQELTRRHIECRGVGSKDLDITDRAAVLEYVKAYQPDAVIHCAAYTAVDKAEDEPEKCMAVNRDGTRYLAEACKAAGAKMLYISTDYVFDGHGDKPFEVDDPTGPLNVYGVSKLAGEEAVKAILAKYFIVRISWVFGSHGNNFVKTMLLLGKERTDLNVVCDQWGSPTYTADLAPLLCDMIGTEKYGTYHATNEGTTNWASFAKEIFRQAGFTCAVHPIPAVEYPTKAKRPENSRLSKSHLDEAGFKRLPEWEDGLDRYLNQ